MGGRPLKTNGKRIHAQPFHPVLDFETVMGVAVDDRRHIFEQSRTGHKGAADQHFLCR